MTSPQEFIFVIKVNKEKQTIGLFQPLGDDGKGKGVALDYSKTKLKRGLMTAARVINDVLAHEL